MRASITPIQLKSRFGLTKIPIEKKQGESKRCVRHLQYHLLRRFQLISSLASAQLGLHELSVVLLFAIGVDIRKYMAVTGGLRRWVQFPDFR